ncbi:unnamed protein product [Schistosoma mattheei]|uniref:Uncharacterized protein n=1 Tax=Schistosoma mattheei TaxID=31246 RepID=A0A3P8IPU1_9TREM|nr:unnamed protein product [Schistosoma mattheei]
MGCRDPVYFVTSHISTEGSLLFRGLSKPWARFPRIPNKKSSVSGKSRCFNMSLFKTQEILSSLFCKPNLSSSILQLGSPMSLTHPTLWVIAIR